MRDQSANNTEHSRPPTFGPVGPISKGKLRLVYENARRCHLQRPVIRFVGRPSHETVDIGVLNGHTANNIVRETNTPESFPSFYHGAEEVNKRRI